MAIMGGGREDRFEVLLPSRLRFALAAGSERET
jgi:hypothetical protein